MKLYKKIIRIIDCQDCKFIDYDMKSDFTYKATCQCGLAPINNRITDLNEIPEWCPLEDWED